MVDPSRRRFLQGLSLLPLAGCGAPPPEDPPLTPPGATPFAHGVASGDPRARSVTLWTRVSAPGEGPVPLTWELSERSDFAALAARGDAVAEPAADRTVHVTAAGLAPGRTYYYRFRALGALSPVGRTRTAPEGRVDRLRLAAVSCNSKGHGYWHVFRRLAARADLDVVLHLGDSIYEYASFQYGAVRPVDPRGPCRTLSDYRRRYADYRADPDLREMLRQHPLIPVWDDHEFADNAWTSGAGNHDPRGDGDWTARASAAAQAWREWLPAEPGERTRIWRSFTFGDLVELPMLDTRLWGRAHQVAISDPMTMDMRRQLLGDDQERWLFDRLTRSTARWKVLGQQVMLSPLREFRDPDQWDGYPSARQRLVDLIRRMNLRDVAVLTGDRHASWAMDVPVDPAQYDPATGNGAAAVEFVTPAVSSPSIYSMPESLRPTFLAQNPHVRFLDLVERGYVVVDVTPERLQGAFFHVRDVERADGGEERLAAALSAQTGVSHLREDATAAEPRADAPPLAPA
ncbi:MAG: alkaline phosphatase D family protein [Polyangiales bacterium]